MNLFWSFALGTGFGLLVSPIGYAYLAVQWTSKQKAAFIVSFSLLMGLAAAFGWHTR